jgi:hypothetical protein
MPRYTVVEKNSGIKQEIDATSSKQALYKLALEKSRWARDKQAQKHVAGKIYEAMLKSHEALVLNDPNQMTLPI